MRRHLALREGDGSVSVHPAVRDYFSQLATGQEQGFWHQLIGEQLISLVRKPGWRLPADKASLDIVEEAISHAMRAGETAKAGTVLPRSGRAPAPGVEAGRDGARLGILRALRPLPGSLGAGVVSAHWASSTSPMPKTIARISGPIFACCKDGWRRSSVKATQPAQGLPHS